MELTPAEKQLLAELLNKEYLDFGSRLKYRKDEKKEGWRRLQTLRDLRDRLT